MTDKEKLYAVKNDKGEWLYSDEYNDWVDHLSQATFYDTFEDADDDIECWELSNAHVVELAEAPAKVVVPQWFDEWLDAFHYLDPQGRVVAPVGRIAQQGWGASADQPFLGRENLDGTVTPRLTIPQTNYLYDHKKELMLVALTGDYTIEKPKRWNVKVPKKWSGDYKRYWKKEQDGGLTWVFLINKDSAQQFTLTEIEQYGLQDCEKEEVTDDGMGC